MLVIAMSAVLSWTLSSWQMPGAIAQSVRPLERITQAIVPYLLGLIRVLLLLVYVPMWLGWSG